MFSNTANWIIASAFITNSPVSISRVHRAKAPDVPLDAAATWNGFIAFNLSFETLAARQSRSLAFRAIDRFIHRADRCLRIEQAVPGCLRPRCR